MESAIWGKSPVLNLIGKVNILPGAIRAEECRPFKEVTNQMKNELHAIIEHSDRLLLKQSLENEWK